MIIMKIVEGSHAHKAVEAAKEAYDKNQVSVGNYIIKGLLGNKIPEFNKNFQLCNKLFDLSNNEIKLTNSEN